ncbi:MAG: polyribonucleotide nucleotidyltransferase [Candidatus Margulisiibacteriota bacterium]
MNKVELTINGKPLIIETGRLAKQADGSVVVRCGDTMVLATATASVIQRQGIDFFPLLVDFEEKLYAAGRIPGSYFRREGRPTERAIITARLIDRPIRPLFPEGFRNDVQIVVTPLSVDQENPPDILAINGASTALTISDIPFEGPVGAVRVGKIDGKYVINPTFDEIGRSELDLIVAGTKDKVVMIEAGAKEVSEEIIIEGVAAAQDEIKRLVELQLELAKKVGKEKIIFKLYVPDENIEKKVKELLGDNVEQALRLTDRYKQEEALSKLKEDIVAKIEAGSDEALKKLVTERKADISNIFKGIEEKIVRHMILGEKKRVDGRKMDEVRAISCDTAILPRAHGSGLFTRGETQVLTVATLGSAGDEQVIEGLKDEEEVKRYMHHYNFPAYSVGEVRPLRGPGRREIGHGALAERALMPVLPSKDEFPYAIRLVSEVLGSNGSSSMASTCGSTLALMDAGVPITSPVSGVAMGLVQEGNKVAILTDIAGIEDHLGDMDFKVTGTSKGITAMQMDVKIKGIDAAILKDALSEAKKGRLFILDKIVSKISTPRAELSPYAPRVITLQIPIDKIGTVIGPGGKMIRKIIEETGAKIDIEDDGKVFISSPDGAALEKAKNYIVELTAEIEVGKTYTGRVTRIMNFGAFVEVLPGKEGLVHISQLDNRRVERVEDVVKVGDTVTVKAVEIDDQGRINLSRKAAM